jgi:hypothetical protein
MAIDLRFVDKIDASPATRLNLNDGILWRFQRQPPPDFSPPPLKRSVVDTLLREGSKVAASAYDNRRLVFDLVVEAGSEDLMATQLQTLHRELDRELNILKYQPDGATNPVFFRTLRSPVDRLAIHAEKENRLRCKLDLLAEPFAYGLKVSESPVTVYNDPAAGSNGCYWDVTGVTGDVPTPAYITMPSGANNKVQCLSVRRHGTPGGVYVIQAEDMSQQTDTTKQANDAAMSGAGQNWSRCTFAGTPGVSTRLQTTDWPEAGSSKEYRGRYRVFMRCRKTVAGDDIKVLLNAVDPNLSTWVTLPNQSWLMWVDLGIATVPYKTHDTVMIGYSNVEHQIYASGVTVKLYAKRDSGSGNLDFDVFVLVPADEEMALTTIQAGSMNFVFDGPNDSAIRLRTVSPFGIFPGGTLPRAGSFPLLTPNQTNRLALMHNIGGELQADVLGASLSVTVEYWPRWLYVRP